MGHSALRQRLTRSLTSAIVMVQTLKTCDTPWERLADLDADYLIVDRAIVPDPADRSITLIRQLPDAPAVVILSHGENAEERARFLALGCEAVLNATPPPGSLCEPLNTILNRVRLRTIGDQLTQMLLTSTGGQIGLTARRAGVRPRSLYDKMKRYGLHKEDFKAR